tara:strand:+ start:2113 stop:3267 length:1155 start_codon:yes stop_codon:yes gene_type:complete
VEIEQTLQRAIEGSEVRFSTDSINKNHGAIRDAARIQLLVSIAKVLDNKKLILQNSSDWHSVVEHLCSYSPGIVGARMFQNIDIGGKLISRRDVLKSAASRIAAMDTQNYNALIRGKSIDFCCIGGAKKRFLSPLFYGNSISCVREPSDMVRMLTKVEASINKNSNKQLPNNFMSAFGVFLSELFKNTQEHALRDPNDIQLIEHVEGLLATFSSYPTELYSDDFSSNPTLKNYLENNTTENSSGQKLFPCIQLSIFDSGPGLVGRAFGYKDETYGRAQERIDLLKCLQKNFSSKPEKAAGEGYPLILEHLADVGGLIRIRSGRHCIFKCFEQRHNDSANEINLNSPSILESFEDWMDFDLPKVEGTVVSILVPLRKAHGQQLLL